MVNVRQWRELSAANTWLLLGRSATAKSERDQVDGRSR